MWHIHTVTGEQGWHICQKHTHRSDKLLVFVNEEPYSWKMKAWNINECTIRAKTHDEHVQDDITMTNSGFSLNNPSTLTPKEYLTSNESI
jgi:hypothetical protein